MTTLQKAVGEVPALRDRLDIASLNVLSATCHELNDSTRLSDTYRQEYRKVQAKCYPYDAMLFGSPVTDAPAADFKRALWGMRVHRTQLACDAPRATRAELEAQQYYLNLAYPPEVAKAALTSVSDRQSRWAMQQQSMREHRNEVVGALLGVGVTVAVSVGLFLSSTGTAAVVVLIFLAAVYLWMRRSEPF